MFLHLPKPFRSLNIKLDSVCPNAHILVDMTMESGICTESE